MRIQLYNHDIWLDPTQHIWHHGRFGITYLLTLPNNDKIVVKQYKPKKHDHPFEQRRFLRQAEIMNALYPELQPQKVEIENQLFFYYRYIDGITLNFPLKKEIKQHKENILIKILQELQRLHQLKYIHTDLKPSNILIQYDKIFLLDFGNCIALNESLPRNYIIPFTMIYAPPEMILNRYDLCTFSSDLYMWALVAFQILTEVVPFSHCNPIQLMHMQLNAKPSYHYLKNNIWHKIITKATDKFVFPKPPHFYDSATIEHFLIKGIEKRYATAEEILNELK
ncbi:MAG: protein kinase [Bacteroidales bacterium]|nr:protein kinase [Bacteroidales bacterium]